MDTYFSKFYFTNYLRNTHTITHTNMILLLTRHILSTFGGTGYLIFNCNVVNRTRI